MTKHDLLKKLAEANGSTASAAEKFLDSLIDVVVGEINSGNDIIVPGFAKFSPRHRPSRPGRNPQTGETLTTKATNSIAFHPLKELRGKIAQP